ncbi:MAG: ATP-dependent zinc metalloprotease FtsH [Candidatus Ureaplasma intestinipullorum]|uniref:ATP-dependent zinc metalloprotease FtsH n=1 Tax=Candidatus Ureaplasma intestinipullorum TaxID=2838770 RepID=A0A9E2KW78_9BACT|nr:ATP-dependent zinc metalloprotease FtsH [Candidatus Ureaplasma intestinipullorum]
MSSEDISDNRKKLTKRIIIWTLVLGALGGIIAAIVVTATKKSAIALGPNTTLTSKTENVIEFTDNNTTYTVDLNDPNSYVAAYYGAVKEQIYLQLHVKNYSLPIEIMVSKQSFGTSLQYTIADKLIVVDNDNAVLNPDPNINTTLQSLADLLLKAFHNATTASAGFNWLGLLSALMPLIVILILFFLYSFLIKRQMGGMGQDSIFGMGKSNTKPVKTNVKFSDVAGIDEVKTELSELVDYVKNPSKYSAMGARAPKGVILYGPPGTGKTLIAKAVAGEANCAFYAIAGSSFDDMLVGVGAKRVRDLFQKARKTAPSIIFIDEIDSVASKRGKNDIIGGGSGVADQTINQLLAEMDGFTTDSGVIVIAATNRIDVLDEAILRPGRFDRQIQVTLPDIKGREEILKIHSKNKNISSSVNLTEVARRTPGFSGAQLENVLNEATLLAVRENKKVVSMKDIDEGIDRVIGGPARHGRIISEHERKQIAYHEAGHALVGLFTDNTEVVQKITIIPRGDAAGYTLQTPQEKEKVIQTKSDILNQVRMTLGGRASEEIIFGQDNISSGAANDLYKVTNMVRAMVMQLGMTSVGLTQFVPSEGTVNPYQQKLYSESTAIEIDKMIESIIQKEYKLAKDIIVKNKVELELIVETLLLLETIVKEQIDYIHENLQLPPEAIEAKNKLNEK